MNPEHGDANGATMAAPQPFSSTATERNKTPIFEHLVPLLASAERVLEVGAGDGTHARHAVGVLPRVTWQVSEQPKNMPRLVQAVRDCPALPPPLALDVGGSWPSGLFAAVYGANVSHIMAWDEVVALFVGAAAVLDAAGLLCLYGPFFDDELATVPSNLAFDQRLRERQPTMGLRRRQALDELAAGNGLRQHRDWLMPANNRLLVWQKQ